MADIKVGARVLANGRLGVIRFVGETSFQVGQWIGVELDQPEGKNDGSVEGVRYFTCAPKHGSFVRPAQIAKVGATPAAPAAAAAASPSVSSSSSAAASGLKKPSSTPAVAAASGSATPRVSGGDAPAAVASGLPKPRTVVPVASSSDKRQSLAPPASSRIPVPSSSRHSISGALPSLSVPASSPSVSAVSSPQMSAASSLASSPVLSPAEPPAIPSLSQEEAEQQEVPVHQEEPIQQVQPQPTPVVVETPAPAAPHVEVKHEEVVAPVEEEQPASVVVEEQRNGKQEEKQEEDGEESEEDEIEKAEESPARLSDLPQPLPSSSSSLPSPASSTFSKNDKLLELQQRRAAQAAQFAARAAAASASSSSSSSSSSSVPSISSASSPIAASVIRPSAATATAAASPDQTAALARAQTQIEALEKTLKEREEEHKKSIDELKKKSDKDSAAFKKSEEALQTLGERLAKATNELKSTESEMQKLKHAHDEKISELQHELEMARIDKELAEEKAGELESQLSEANDRVSELELEAQIRMEESALASEGGDDLTNLMQQNEKLKQALVKLRDHSLAEKQESSRKLKELEFEVAKISGLQEQIRALEVYPSMLKESQEQMADLQDQLDTARQSEAMLEELTEKNLALEEEIEEFKVTVSDLESFRATMEDLEHLHVEEKLELRLKIDSLEVENSNHVQQIEMQTKLLNERQATMSKFRDKVRSLEEEVEQLHALTQDKDTQSQQLRARSDHVSTLVGQLQVKLAKTRSSLLDQELRTLEAEYMRRQFSMTLDLMPEGLMETDISTLRAIGLVERLSSKADIASNFAREYLTSTAASGEQQHHQQNDDDDASSPASSANNNNSVESLSSLIFLNQLRSILSLAVFCIRRLHSDAVAGGVSSFMDMARFLQPLADVEREFDGLLNLFASVSFSPANALPLARNLIRKCSALNAGIIRHADNLVSWSSLSHFLLATHFNAQTLSSQCEAVLTQLRTLFKASSDEEVAAKSAATKSLVESASSLRDQCFTISSLCRKASRFASQTSSGFAPAASIQFVRACFASLSTLSSVYGTGLEAITQVVHDVSLGLRDANSEEVFEEISSSLDISSISSILTSTLLPASSSSSVEGGEQQQQAPVSSLDSLSFSNILPALLSLYLPASNEEAVQSLSQSLPSSSSSSSSLLEHSISTLEQLSDDLLRNEAPSSPSSTEDAPRLQRATQVRTELAAAPTLRSTVSALESEVQKIRAQLSTRSTELSEEKSNVEVLEKKLHAFKIKVDEYDSLRSKMESMDKLQSEVTKLKETEKMYTEAIQALEDDVSNLERENSALKQAANKLSGAPPVLAAAMSAAKAAKGAASSSPVSMASVRSHQHQMFQQLYNSEEMQSMQSTLSYLRRLVRKQAEVRSDSLMRDLLSSTNSATPSASSASSTLSEDVSTCLKDLDSLLKEIREAESQCSISSSPSASEQEHNLTRKVETLRQGAQSILASSASSQAAVSRPVAQPASASAATSAPSLAARLHMPALPRSSNQLLGSLVSMNGTRTIDSRRVLVDSAQLKRIGSVFVN